MPALSPKSSNAPAIIKDSIAFLFRFARLPNLHNDSIESKTPMSSLASITGRRASEPTFLTAARPNLILCDSLSTDSTLNPIWLLLISGGNTSIPILLQSATAEINRSLLSIYEFINDAIYSAG